MARLIQINQQRHSLVKPLTAIDEGQQGAIESKSHCGGCTGTCYLYLLSIGEADDYSGPPELHAPCLTDHDPDLLRDAVLGPVDPWLQLEEEYEKRVEEARLKGEEYDPFENLSS